MECELASNNKNHESIAEKTHTCVLTLTTHTFVLFIEHFKFVIQIIVFFNSVTPYKYVEFLVSSHNQKLLLLKEIKRKIVPSSKKKKKKLGSWDVNPLPLPWPSPSANLDEGCRKKKLKQKIK
jgi:hypothetical protein